MSQMFNKVAETIFQTLKGFGYTLILFDVFGQKILEPSQARRIFCNPDKFMVAINELGANSEIKIYLSKSFDIKKNNNLIQTLRTIANHWNLLFSIKKYGKELTPKMFAFMAVPISENHKKPFYSRFSQKYYDSKIIQYHINHDYLNEKYQTNFNDSAKRVYLETKNGEKLLVPENSILLAKSLAAYLSSGGRPIDEGFCQLCKIHEIYNQIKSCRKNIPLENIYRPLVESLLNKFSKIIKNSLDKNKVKKILENYNWPLLSTDEFKKPIKNVNSAINYLKGFFKMPMMENDKIKLRRGWEIDPITGQPKFVGTKRDRERIARGELPRDPRLRNVNFDLEDKKKRDNFKKDFPVTPKALEIKKFLTDVYDITGGGDVSDKEMLEQAKRITAGYVRLVNPAVIDKPKIVNSPNSKISKIIWNLSEISQRLGVRDLVLANILSRIADALEIEMSGRTPPFNVRDAKVRQLVNYVLTKFKNEIMEKKQRNNTFPEMRELTEWFDRFVPEALFETRLKKK